MDSPCSMIRLSSHIYGKENFDLKMNNIIFTYIRIFRDLIAVIVYF